MIIGLWVLIVGWKLIVVGWQVGRVWDGHTVVSGWWKQVIALQRQVIDGRCKRGSILIVWGDRREILAVWGVSSRDVIVTEAQNVRIESDIVVKQFLLVAESEGRTSFKMMRRWRIIAFKVRFKVMRRAFKMRWSMFEMGAVMGWSMFKMRVMVVIKWNMRGWRRIGMEMFVFMVMQSAFFACKESSDCANDSLIWREMKIHKRLEQFLSVFTLGDLEGEEWIHIE